MKNAHQSLKKACYFNFILTTVVLFAAHQAVSNEIYVQQAKLTAVDSTANDEFGCSVAIDGDDIIVGARGRNDYMGTAFAFARSGTTWTQIAKLDPIIRNTTTGKLHFGYSVAISGNIALIGAPYQSYYYGGSAYDPPSSCMEHGAVHMYSKSGGIWGTYNNFPLNYESDLAGHGYHFGSSVARDGSTTVVGVPDRYVMVFPAGQPAAQLQPFEPMGQAGFGLSVAISGDTIVVGAPAYDSSRGMACIFVKPPSGWIDMYPVSFLSASDGAAGDNFGCSVAIYGNTVIVGASGDNTLIPLLPPKIIGDHGSAYVFVRPQDGWSKTHTHTHKAKLTASDKASHDEFGTSVAISGDRVAVGAPGDDNYKGSAYVFIKPPGGWVTKTQDDKLTASDGAASDSFGYSVAIDGDTVVVGAWGNGTTNKGAAYAFKESSQSTTTTTVDLSSTTTTIESTSTTTTADGTTTTTAQGPSSSTTVPIGDITVEFTASPRRGFAPLEVHFFNASSGHILGYEWTFGDGTTSTEKNPSHTYVEKGRYSVVLTVEGADLSSHTKLREEYIRVFPGLPCVASMLLEDRDEIMTLKQARDALLSKPTGMMLVYLYYRHAAEMQDIVVTHPEIGDKLQELIYMNMDVAKAMVAGESIAVSNETIQSAVSIIEEIRDAAGEELAQSIDLLLLGIRNGYLFNALQIGLE